MNPRPLQTNLLGLKLLRGRHRQKFRQEQTAMFHQQQLRLVLLLK
jgi:hypothetical protein